MKNDIVGRLAVVTGAGSGIGLSFCRELADRGCRLVMVSNQDTLAETAENVGKEFNVETYSLYCDLTNPDCAVIVTDFLTKHNLEADYLINNAGIFSFSAINETSDKKIECFIDLHIRAVTTLSKAFATRFAKRGGGRILNMSSMSCWMPMPGIAMYSATKAYIRVFSRALHYEVCDAGVSVTVACPGGIATSLFGLPEKWRKFAVSIGVLATPEKFAGKAINKMLKGKKQYINGLLNRFSIFFVSILPTRVRLLIKRRMLDKGIKV